MPQLRRVWQMARSLGPNWLLFRARHALRMKSGIVRWQNPATNWSDQPLSKFLKDGLLSDPAYYANYRATSAPRFFFHHSDFPGVRSLLKSWDHDDCDPSRMADAVRDGLVTFFSHQPMDVGFPPRWHVDPTTSIEFPSDRHWSQIGDFSAGDIKLVWETNRFGFVFALVRAYARTGDERHAELFWQLIESWRTENAPEQGANWKCGQEVALRAMAWCFGFHAFAGCRASTPDRLVNLAQMMAISARRIESNIGYALSQKNNHGLSEAMGLWTIGSLFPEFRDAARWQAKGRQLLERQARTLVYEDGAFSQHSHNYHRVMLQVYLWCIRLGEILHTPFSETLRERVAAAGDFIDQMMDDATGFVPCYGHNDGALIFPLSNCDYRDFRPIVQAVRYQTCRERRFASGAWDEELFWFHGAAPFRTDSSTASSDSASRQGKRSDFVAPKSGYVVLRNADGFVASRASGYRHRPSQADTLHVDLWWRGQNIAVDPGTYSYNAPAPWNNSLAATACHNTVVVDGLNQMEQAGRFLWLPWLKAREFGRTEAAEGDIVFWNGEHDGYRRLQDPVTHRRGIVRLNDEHWMIVDSLKSASPHEYRLHWLLLDAPCEIDLDERTVELSTDSGPYFVALSSNSADAELSVVRAADNSTEGWRSPFYYSREPAISVHLGTKVEHAIFVTLMGPSPTSASIQDDRIFIRANNWNAVVGLDLSKPRQVPLITGAELIQIEQHQTRRVTTQA